MQLFKVPIIDYAGMFSAFPFLKLIAVRSRMRNHGIGAAMLSFFEKTGFARNRKVFLCAGESTKMRSGCIRQKDMYPRG